MVSAMGTFMISAAVEYQFDMLERKHDVNGNFLQSYLSIEIL